MKEGLLMRVLFCKILCVLFCFCKPSAAHLYTSGPLKLENTPHVVVVPSTTDFEVSSASQKSFSEVKLDNLNGKQTVDENVVLRSCIKKLPHGHDCNKEVGKKRVQWMDISGKQLAEIKEFESSETGDTDNEDEISRCLCIIL